MNRLLAMAGAVALALTGCGTGPGDAGSAALTVFAAASTKAAFTAIGERFEADNPGSTVEFSFAGSSDLATQLTQGAPADVFASADTRNMDKVVYAGLVDGDPVAFASNSLTIVVAPGNPKGINAFRDLARPGVSVVVCAPAVPCGGATERVERAAGVDLSPVSEESSVTDVLNKVTSGQADAGVVYVTDAAGAGERVTTVAFPEAAQAVNTYPIAVLEQTQHNDLAWRFLKQVTSEAGRQILADQGFTRP